MRRLGALIALELFWYFPNPVGFRIDGFVGNVRLLGGDGEPNSLKYISVCMTWQAKRTRNEFLQDERRPLLSPFVKIIWKGNFTEDSASYPHKSLGMIRNYMNSRVYCILIGACALVGCPFLIVGRCTFPAEKSSQLRNSTNHDVRNTHAI